MWQPLGHRASRLESCIRNEIATLSSTDECLRLAMGKLGTARTFRRPCSGLETGGKRREVQKILPKWNKQDLPPGCV